ncbi:MAG: MFS transporter [Xanthobacteraceae bacterium]
MAGGAARAEPLAAAATLSRRLAAFYAAVFGTLGVQLPFLPVWLAAKGLDTALIGMVLGVPMAVRVFAIPLAARQADRNNALRAILVMAATSTVLAYAVLALTDGALAIAVAFALVALCSSPLMPLADAYALRGLRSGDYGPVRLWGSAAFIVGSLGAGLVLDVIEPRNLIWLIVAASVLTAAAAVTLSPLSADTGKPRASSGGAAALLRDPAFLALCLAASLIQASHAVYYAFSALQWQAAGLGGGSIGLLWALGVVAEIVLFALSWRLSLGPSTWLIAGAAGAATRWCMMALDPPALALPLLQCLHGLSFGATHLGTFSFIARHAPAQAVATAQGSVSVVSGLGMAAFMSIAGGLYAHSAALAYAVMALASVLGAACVWAAQALADRHAGR